MIATLAGILGIAFAVYQYKERKRVKLVVDEILSLMEKLNQFYDTSLPEAQKTIEVIISKLQKIRQHDSRRADIEKKISSLAALLR